MWWIFIASGPTRDFWKSYLKTIVILLFIFHSVITGGVALKGKVPGGKGSYCRINDDCDSSKHLGCFANSCDCWKAHGHIWVSEENSCMLMENAPCGRKENEPRCIRNSTCNSVTCECDSGFLRNGFGNCELSHGRFCSDNEPCSKRHLLECSYDNVRRTTAGYQIWDDNQDRPTCRCRGEGTAYVWDEQKRKCVSTAGGGCDLPDETLYRKDDQLECVKNSKCVKRYGRGVCECENGFKQTREGTCLLQYGERCSPELGLECDKSLLCRDKRCTCKLYGQMEYDDKSGQCKSKIGESCNVFGDAGSETSTQLENQLKYDEKLRLECGKDAYCRKRQGYSTGICSCLPGFELNEERKCSKYKGHGLPCSASVDCDKAKFLECVFDIQLFGRCECTKNMFYDGKGCRVYPGQNCENNLPCSEHAYCEGTWCVCKPGYVIGHTDCISSTREPRNEKFASSTQSTWMTTVSEEESRTKLHSQCDNLAERSVEWKKCKCSETPHTHIWIANENSCLALVGTKCSDDFECVPQAICHSIGNVCQCPSSKVTTHSRMCVTPSSPINVKDHDSSVYRTHEEDLLHNPADDHQVAQKCQDCPEFHTLKSVSPMDAYYGSSGTMIKISLVNIFAIVFVLKLL